MLLATHGEVSVVTVDTVDGDMEWVLRGIMVDRDSEWVLQDILVDMGRLGIFIYNNRMKNNRNFCLH